jgi:regulator of protease activity HflC (stomatin/prohibitin superfamily)
MRAAKQTPIQKPKPVITAAAQRAIESLPPDSQAVVLYWVHRVARVNGVLVRRSRMLTPVQAEAYKAFQARMAAERAKERKAREAYGRQYAAQLKRERAAEEKKAKARIKAEAAELGDRYATLLEVERQAIRAALQAFPPRPAVHSSRKAR